MCVVVVLYGLFCVVGCLGGVGDGCGLVLELLLQLCGDGVVPCLGVGEVSL